MCWFGMLQVHLEFFRLEIGVNNITNGGDCVKTQNSPAPYLATEEYRQLIAEATYHLVELCGFKDGTFKEYWRLAELRILTVISDIGAQYDGNTKLQR